MGIGTTICLLPFAALSSPTPGSALKVSAMWPLARGRVDAPRKHPFLGGAKSLVGPVAHIPKRCTICCTFAFKFWPFHAQDRYENVAEVIEKIRKVVLPSGFQDRRIQPLCHSSTLILLHLLATIGNLLHICTAARASSADFETRLAGV